jgi:hypothetical protein
MIGNENITALLQKLAGENIRISETEKSVIEKEELIFIDTIETLEYIYDEDHKLNELYGVDLLGHVQHYYHIIENLVVSKYGDDKADIIWWWILERFAEDGELLGVETKDGKVHVLETPIQLWRFLQKV